MPITKIISRFDKSLNNLREIIPEIERAYMYDNSVENVLPALQFRTVRGAAQKVYSEGHYWADSLRAQVSQLQQGQFLAGPATEQSQGG